MKLLQRRDRPPLRGWIGQTVLLHTKTDLTISGILDIVAEDVIVLVAASVVDEQVVSLDGPALIPRREIAFVQRPTQPIGASRAQVVATGSVVPDVLDDTFV